jgi:hypothetical protein
MLSTVELFKNLSELTLDKFGFDGGEVEQGTPEWHRMRAGVITASRVHDIIKKGRAKGSYSAARQTYMNELIAQVCTGLLPDQLTAKQVAWGHENEPKALALYDPFEDKQINQIAFVYGLDMRCGVSPDALVNDNGGLEIKCPWTTSQYIDQLLGGEPKPEYLTQMQYSMWLTGREYWDFANYDPRMKKSNIHVVKHEPDLELFKVFGEEIPKFIEDMDKKLADIGFKFSDIYTN